MNRVTGVFILLALTVVGQALTPSTYFTVVDQGRLRNIFTSVRPYGEDLESVYYSVLGFHLLAGGMETAHKACDAIKANIDATSVESLFHASSAAVALKTLGGNCQLSPSGAQQVLDDAITEEAPTLTIYYAVASLHNLGLKIDVPKVSAALTAALKTDDAPLSHGYAFYAASFLSGDLKKFHDLIEDVIAQADEVDELYLQFEGGLYTTAVVLDAAYKLSAAAKLAPTITEDKVIKFANYFLSRKHVQSLKNAATLLSTIKTLTDNKYHIPIAVSLNSQVSVSDQFPTVQVRVSNLLGKSLGKVTVTADTARHLGDDAVVMSKKPFTPSPNDNSLYELDFLNVKVKPVRGFYKITISASPAKADTRLLGTTGAEVEVKVTTEVAIENVGIGVADKEQSTAPRTTKLQYPKTAVSVVEADYHQRITMKFQLKDKTSGQFMKAHQTFVRMTNQETKQEIIFVAEADNSDLYKFDLDVGAKAKDFNYMSGKYTMELIIGDAVIQNPFSWVVADVELTFPEGSGVTKDDQYRYAPRPEIKHMFREPEKTPPVMVSNLFSGLVLVPVVILLILWLRIGVNVSNFPLSLSALGFHVGLGAIFGLYYCYWVHLNMFQTLRYLGLIGIPTFLFGNRLLSGIAAKRK